MLETLGDDPYRHDIYMRLGRVYKIEGDVNESIKYFSRAVKINIGNYVAQNELGKMLIEKNNAQEALTHFESALRACPEFEEIHINRAKALIMLGKHDKAIENLELFIQRNPNSVEGHYWLSVALNKIGETSRAVNHLKKTLELAPDWVIPINNLAYILAINKDPEISDVNEAVVLAKRACELTNYRHPEILDTLAVAYASAGKFTEAVFYAEKAVSLAELYLNEEQLEGLREHLRLFRQRQTVIE
jgi:tetratricopeptide (TPR) repeat protein